MAHGVTSADDLFSIVQADTRPEHDALVRAERLLLQLADLAYARASLKPMSKALFFVSRSLLASTSQTEPIRTGSELLQAYEDARRNLGAGAPTDDFSLSAVISDCGPHLPTMVQIIHEVRRLTAGTDSLGLAFNTLLRGKWESGEGLGTFLTPEEVATPMVAMALKALPESALAQLKDADPSALFGDICGGTGRFVYLLARELARRGVSRERLGATARLFDQSSLAVDFARINFAFEGCSCHFESVADSLTDSNVDVLRGRFALLATNPPFGSGKYPWSPALTRTMNPRVLQELDFRGAASSADPSVLFFFRNLDLLINGGVLAIVLPDGVMQSTRFRRAVDAFEEETSTDIEFLAAVSLPSTTFALGGTVAKTSFVIARRSSVPSRSKLYVASAKHVGFLKRGNRRAADKAGNDLFEISEEFLSDAPRFGRLVDDWKGHENLRLAAAAQELESNGNHPERGPRIADVARVVRVFAPIQPVTSGRRFHVSILDVDETGLVDLLAASHNRPASRGLGCAPGDVLLSCINPRIWRVAVVPDIEGEWTCSPEFVVLRAATGCDPWRLALALHHSSIQRAVAALAGGTSSSRQRVPKDQVLDVRLPVIEIDAASLARHVEARKTFYDSRLLEIDAYLALHDGKRSFALGEGGSTTQADTHPT